MENTPAAEFEARLKKYKFEREIDLRNQRKAITAESKRRKALATKEMESLGDLTYIPATSQNYSWGFVETGAGNTSAACVRNHG